MQRLRSIAIALLLALIPLGVAAGVAILVVYGHYSRVVDEKFSGRRWDFPSQIFAEEFSLHPGLDLEASGFDRRLERLRYRSVDREPRAGGEFREVPEGYEIALRPGARGRREVERVRLLVDDGRIQRVEDLRTASDRGAVSLEPEELTGIYDGEWQKRRAIRVIDVAPILVRAILVTEDGRYFRHYGVDLIGVGRAALTNLRAGEVRQGGSTLTQQLMKNFFLSSDRTMSRKLEEAVMALVAEHRYSKMQILENYLNEIYLGQRGARGIFGVAEAADFFFGKDPRDLEVGEAAMIAGLIRAPNAYSPHRHPDRARQRRDVVLAKLHEAGEIDEETRREAASAGLRLVPPAPETAGVAFFVDFVKRELLARFGATVLTTEGLRVHTTLDPIVQEHATEAVRRGLEDLEQERPELARADGGGGLEGSLLAISPRSGAIRALVGGRDYGSSQFDRATQARRQSGSAFKPIVFLAGVVAAEPERHLTAASLVDDRPFTWEYDGREWTPKNHGDIYRGEITARTALEQSSNAATARIAHSVGLDAIIEMAREMGVETPLPRVPSVTLGAAEVSLREMVAAYGVLASGGMRAEPFAIWRVETRTGDELLGEVPELTRVVSPAQAFVVTHMLEGVFDHGTGRSARRRGFERAAAGKTGTTNDGRDAWFVGFTPDLLAGAWVGFDDGRPAGLAGAGAALPIWTDFMAAASEGLPPRAFQPPSGITLLEVDRDTGSPRAAGGRRSVQEAFLSGEEPRWSDPLSARSLSP
jgi:penicillin-binding protein 1B